MYKSTMISKFVSGNSCFIYFELYFAQFWLFIFGFFKFKIWQLAISTNMDTVSPYTAKNNQCLDLNEFTVTEFINLIYAYYKTDLPQELQLVFVGDCEFRITILVRWIFISLKSEHEAMMNLLRIYPSSMRMDLTYAYYNSEHRQFELEDFQILRDIWKLHADFKRIEIASHNVTFTRFSPKRLQMLCMWWVDDYTFAHLPMHVLKRLKYVTEFEDSESDVEIGKCFKFLRWEDGHLVVRNWKPVSDCNLLYVILLKCIYFVVWFLRNCFNCAFLKSLLSAFNDVRLYWLLLYIDESSNEL